MNAIKNAFLAGYRAGSTDASPVLPFVYRPVGAYEAYEAARLAEGFAQDEDELDEPIAYQLTPLGLKGTDRGVCLDEWLARNQPTGTE